MSSAPVPVVTGLVDAQGVRPCLWLGKRLLGSEGKAASSRFTACTPTLLCQRKRLRLRLLVGLPLDRNLLLQSLMQLDLETGLAETATARCELAATSS